MSRYVMPGFESSALNVPLVNTHRLADRFTRFDETAHPEYVFHSDLCVPCHTGRSRINAVGQCLLHEFYWSGQMHPDLVDHARFLIATRLLHIKGSSYVVLLLDPGRHDTWSHGKPSHRLGGQSNCC